MEQDPELAFFVEALRNPEPGDFDASVGDNAAPERPSELVQPPRWIMELLEQKLAGPADPRWRYQEIYHGVAEAVRKPARLALARRPWWKSWWEGLLDSFQQSSSIGLSIDPLLNEFIVGVPKRAMLPAASGNHDLLKLRIEPGSEEPHIKLFITSCTSDSFWLDIVDSDKNETQTLALTNSGESKQLELLAYRAYVFRLRDAQGQLLEVSIDSTKAADGF